MQSTGGFVCGTAHSPRSDQDHVHSQTADGRLSTNSTFSDGIKNSQNELVLDEPRLQQVSPYIPARLFFVYVHSYRHIWINASFWCVSSCMQCRVIYIYIYGGVLLCIAVCRLLFVVYTRLSSVVYCWLICVSCSLVAVCCMVVCCVLCNGHCCLIVVSCLLLVGFVWCVFVVACSSMGWFADCCLSFYVCCLLVACNC